jgi:hypothetical protein
MELVTEVDEGTSKGTKSNFATKEAVEEGDEKENTCKLLKVRVYRFKDLEQTERHRDQYI